MNSSSKSMQNPDWLLAFKHDVKSQFGEDGILAQIFKVVTEESRFAVELGALNGYHHSNTWHLIKDNGWSAVLLEADQTYFERMVEEYAEELGYRFIGRNPYRDGMWHSAIWMDNGGSLTIGHFATLRKVKEWLLNNG